MKKNNTEQNKTKIHIFDHSINNNKQQGRIS